MTSKIKTFSLEVLQALDASTMSVFGRGKPRGYCGASGLGKKCSREVWYSFRWFGQESFPARILRLFDRGDREEHALVKLLRGAGVEVWDTQPGTENQIAVPFDNPHVGGHVDAVCRNVPGLPSDAFVLGEFKTHNQNQFNKLQRSGVKESHPVHYAQSALYCYGLKLDYIMYLGVNKNDDDIHPELHPPDHTLAQWLLQRADLIVYSNEPPPRISSSPSWHECKWCTFYNVCHKQRVPAATCRSCRFSTPLPDGNWLCEKHGHLLTVEAQLVGCSDHVYLSGALNMVIVESEEEDHTVLTLDDGNVIRNGPNHITSEALCSYGTTSQQP